MYSLVVNVKSRVLNLGQRGNGGGVAHRRDKIVTFMWTFAGCLAMLAADVAYAMKRLSSESPAARAAAAPAAHQPPASPSAQPSPVQQSFIRIDFFEIGYATQVNGQVDPQIILDELTVGLTQTPDGYVAPFGGAAAGQPVKLQVRLLPKKTEHRFAPSALRAVVSEVVSVLTKNHGLIGVVARVDQNDVTMTPDNAAFIDRRPPGRTAVRIVIETATLRESRTLARGERFKPGEIDNPAHQRIVQNSPVEQGEVINKDWLDNYIFWLSRHPGRRVDIAVDASREPGHLALDYLVAESKPWIVFAQVSNTGTEATNEWRERFGFIHNQLTSNDDILNLQYITAGFDESHALSGSYEAPFPGLERLRWRATGSWSQFDASEVGQFAEEFHGEDWSAGGQIIWNFFQRRELFIDLFAGARWQHIMVKNDTTATEGQDDFFVPTVGVSLERFTDTATSAGSVAFEWNLPDVADTDADTPLGRSDTDRSWVALLWNLNHSFYLDPLFFGSNWEDDKSGFATLAHEVSLSLDGQYAFGHRLVPQFEQVAGGFFSVRGYPESATAGDTVVIGRADYMFHWPRSFARSDETATIFGQPFHRAPSRAYGRADWDLIFRAFFDAARVINSNRVSFESDETLLGTGVGVEFQFKQNFTARADWGVALRSLRGTDVDAGDNRFHILFTVLY